MTDALIGKQLGGYVVESQIGRGGMATVYLARQTSMNRVVALKVLPRELMRDESYFKRFEREVSIVAQLEHRAIVPVYEHGEVDGQPYIAMRYMSGGSLDAVLAEGALAPDYVLHLLSQIAPALDYAHSKGVLHRDLKPSNVLLDDAGGAYITDFGVARLMSDPNVSHTITTQGVVGTPSYMSPEQAQAQTLDGRSDIYALGIVLFELLTGRRPFQSDTPYSIAVMQVTATPPSPRSFNANLSLGIEQVILKTIRKNPDERYPTAGELLGAMRLAVESSAGFNPADTQPVRRSNAAATQPIPVQSTPMPSPPAMPLTGYLTRQQDYPSALLSSSLSARVQSVRRRGPFGGVWMNLGLGVLIGCGLLTVVGILMVLLASGFMERFSPQPTPRAATLSDTPAPTSATDPQPTGTLGGFGTEATPAPIGVRDPFDGRLVYAFWEDSPTQAQIFLKTIRQGEAVQLTSDETPSLSPAVSPDGQRIAFIALRDGDADLYVMDTSGGALQKLFDSSVDESNPTWSPDGQWIYVASDVFGTGAASLMRVRTDGSSTLEHVYSSNDGRTVINPRVAPDGLRVVFAYGQPTDARTWEIVAYDLEAQQLIQVTSNGQRDNWPVYSPDGQWLYWVAGAAAQSVIWRTPADLSGASNRVYSTKDYVTALNISPNGAFLLFNAGEVSESIGQLFALPITGGERTTFEVVRAYGADWAQ